MLFLSGSYLVRFLALALKTFLTSASSVAAAYWGLTQIFFSSALVVAPSIADRMSPNFRVSSGSDGVLGELALAAFWAALCAFLSAFSSSVGGVGQGFSATGSPPNLAAMSLVDWAMPWAMRTTSWGLRSSASRRSKNRMSWFLISVGFPAAVYQEESC